MTPSATKDASYGSDASERSRKQGSEALRAAVRQTLALNPDVRDRVLSRFRFAGGDLRRWARADVARMSDAMTREEDALEVRGARHDVARAALRGVRRLLEVEVWP